MRSMCLPITVFLHLLSVTTAGATFSVLVSNATVLLGRSVTLPCWLSPAVDAEQMDVRWYRNDFNKPVLLYRDHKVQSSPQMEQYQNRTMFVPREPASSGLKQGDVSVRINHVSLEDAGKYVCYASSSAHYESETMFLSVEVIGDTPVMSLSRTKDDWTNVSCTSTGWQPAPQLQWSLGAQQTVQAGALSHSRGARGLVSVQSWVVRPSSESQWVSCSVLLPSRKEDVKEARVNVQIDIPTSDSSASSWRAAFIIALLAIIALIIAIVFLLRKAKIKKAEEGTLMEMPEEGKRLLKDAEEGTLMETPEIDFIWSEAPDFAYFEDMKKYAVDIMLDEGTIPGCVQVAKDGRKLRGIDEASEHDCCVLGNNCFTSGQHYWEVGLKVPNTEVKKSWWVGVAARSVVPIKDPAVVPSTGLVCLCSDHRHGVHIRSGSSYYISMVSNPEVLGVFLDYDNGRLSFYNKKLQQHLVTVKCSFKEPMYPLFNPGRADKSPMEILASERDTSIANEKLTEMDHSQ